MGPGVSSKQYEVHLGERALLFLALRIRKEEKKLAKKKNILMGMFVPVRHHTKRAKGLQ